MDQNNEQTMNNNPATGEKTFTQEQVNAIIGERLAKEKAKSEAALAEREQQLVQRELMLTAKEKINEMGLPVELLDALNVSSPEALDRSLKAVKAAFDKENNNKKPQRVYEEHKLPVFEDHDNPVNAQLRKAMGLR